MILTTAPHTGGPAPARGRATGRCSGRPSAAPWSAVHRPMNGHRPGPSARGSGSDGRHTHAHSCRTSARCRLKLAWVSGRPVRLLTRHRSAYACQVATSTSAMGRETDVSHAAALACSAGTGVPGGFGGSNCHVRYSATPAGGRRQGRPARSPDGRCSEGSPSGTGTPRWTSTPATTPASQ